LEYFNNAKKYLTHSPNALHLRDTAKEEVLKVWAYLSYIDCYTTPYSE
jgi:hypothetical protein